MLKIEVRIKINLCTCIHVGEGNGNPLQYSCLENPMERGSWLATVHRVAKSQTRLNDYTYTYVHVYTFLKTYSRKDKGGKASFVYLLDCYFHDHRTVCSPISYIFS